MGPSERGDFSYGANAGLPFLTENGPFGVATGAMPPRHGGTSRLELCQHERAAQSQCLAEAAVTMAADTFAQKAVTIY